MILGVRATFIGIALLGIEAVARPCLSAATLCIPRVTDRPRMPDDFALALVDALISVDIGNDRIGNAKTPADFLGAASLARGDLECAVRLVETFKTANEEQIRLSATAFSSAVQGLVENQAAAGKLYKAMLDGTSTMGEGTLSETFGKLSAIAESDWDRITMSVVLSMYAFVDPKPDPVTGKMSRSLLTRRTMNTARADLERAFGKLSLDAGPGLSKIEMAVAGLMRSFNPPYQPADEQQPPPPTH